MFRGFQNQYIPRSGVWGLKIVIKVEDSANKILFSIVEYFEKVQLYKSKPRQSGNIH